jgi:hypothetical protein
MWRRVKTIASIINTTWACLDYFIYILGMVWKNSWDDIILDTLVEKELMCVYIYWTVDIKFTCVIALGVFVKFPEKLISLHPQLRHKVHTYSYR